jgi:hypothetical protein
MDTTPNLDTHFADAVRAELVAIGTKKSQLQRRQRRTRLAAAGIIVIAVAGATTAAALVVNTFPGSTHVAPVGSMVSVTRTGTASIDLGPSVKGANSVIVDVTCISDTGNITVPETPENPQGALSTVDPSMQEWAGWDCAKRSTTVHIRDGYLAPGGTSITITADPGTTWKAVARYGVSTTSAWGVNAHGQTYGASNKNGMPDLQGARATNGEEGYVNTKEWHSFKGIGCIDVYESDGATVIGKFSIGVVNCDASPDPGN